MEIEEVMEKVIEVIGELDVEDEVTPEASLLDELELESLQIYELLASLESVFCVRIPEKVLLRIDTVQDLAGEIWKIMEG